MAWGQIVRLTIFQSTLPRGERQTRSSWVHAVKRISIHAPARGATTSALCMTLDNFDFNPRSREGSDLPECLLGLTSIYFNPRSREGSDPCGGAC